MSMQLGMPLVFSAAASVAVDELTDYERAGLDIVFLPEAYTFDSVSRMGYIAARTTSLQIASGILNIYSRTPTVLAMTAAGLDALSDGRFTLGIGASGPQVVEGFHGVPYDKPLARTREVVQICRAVWRRVPVTHDGPLYHLPLGREHGGTGYGRPLKLINQPVRSRIPIVLAALGPSNVALAAELCEGWQPLFYLPEAAQSTFGQALAAGLRLRDPLLGSLRVVVDTHVAITEDPDAIAAASERVRRHLALYIGGMGPRGKNYYNELARRYGFADAAGTVQDLYLSGHKQAAAAAVPDDLVRGVSLIGPRSHVAERVAAFAQTGVRTLNAVPIGETHRERLRQVELLRALAADTRIQALDPRPHVTGHGETPLSAAPATST